MSNNKDTLVPKLRFPEFQNAGEWEVDIVENLILTISPPKKLNSDKYLQSGDFPIIDQSQKFICAWTNDSESLLTDDFPLIVFGDHTCIIKLVNEPFAQGADGIKIFKARKKITTEFLFYFLNHSPIKQENYKRHFSILKEKIVFFPKLVSGEQQKIASCLSSLDEVITGEQQKLELLKEHKKGLLQNLFPQEGETVPKLRFKEFENSGEWEKQILGNLIEIKGRIGYRGYTNNDIVEKGKGAITFSPSNIDDNNQLNFEKVTYISWEKYNESPEIMLQDGFTVLVKTGSSFGKAVFIKDLPEKTTINPQLVVLKPASIDAKFLFLSVCNSFIQKQIKETVGGGAIPTLSQENISRFEILVPPDKHRKEQQKIASCLSSLDEIITAQTQKIEQLQRHKKGLLQGLFPFVSDTVETGHALSLPKKSPQKNDV